MTKIEQVGSKVSELREVPFGTQSGVELPTSGRRLAIGMPVRNVASYLPRLLEVLQEVASLCEDVRLVIAENDSTDSTAHLAAAFAAADTRASLLRYPGLAELLPDRTDRLAFLRNSIVEELLSETNRNEEWTAIILDGDDVTSTLESRHVIDLVQFLEENSQYCAATANSKGRYYDVWTLRCEGWSPDDCWTQVAKRPSSMSRDAAIRTFVTERQRRIEASSAPIAVKSAFGGLAAYRLTDLKSCRYDGSDSGENCCEHVPMHADLTALTGKSLAIVPSVMVNGPVEPPAPSLQRLRSVKRIVRRGVGTVKRASDAFLRQAMRSLAKRVGITRLPPRARGKARSIAVDEFRLIMESDHALPRYTASFRAYDRPIRSVGQLLRRSYGRRIRAIDVGANIGDTAATLVVATGADVLAIEGDSEYLSKLAANMSPLGDRVTVYGHFVTADGSSFPGFTNSNGTGRLVDSPHSPAVDGRHIETRALREVLTELGWADADLFKSDTDGHDFGIIDAALKFPWPVKPVLFFEFDPSLDSGGEAAGLGVIEHAVSKGYQRWYVWDNFGNFMTQVDCDHIVRFEQICTYLANCKFAGGGIHYVDVAAFCDHHPPYDGTVCLRTS